MRPRSCASQRVFPVDAVRRMNLVGAMRLLPLAAVACVAGLTGCGGGGGQYSYQNVTLTVSPQVTSIPVNATVTFTATTTNEPNDPEWILLGYDYANLGSPSVSLGSPTFVYTAPPTPPIYSSVGAFGATQGSVTLQASVPDGATFNVLNSTQTFVITAPSISVGITPATATVPLNTTLQLNAYAVGSVNNAVTLQVNGVTGGSTSVGTISLETTGIPDFYIYTAPANLPMSGATVTITVISQADPTKTAAAVITLH